MLIKYYIYRTLIALGLIQYQQRLDDLILERVKVILRQHSKYIDYGWNKDNTSPTFFDNYHRITYPYVRYLLTQIANGEVKKIEESNLLYYLFISCKSSLDRKLLAKTILNDKGDNLSEFLLSIIPVGYWDVTVEERKSVVKFWLKDIPEHSRIPNFLNQKSNITFKDEILKEMFEILDYNKEFTNLSEYYLKKCSNDFERVVTVKHLIQKHVLTKIEQKGLRFNDTHGDLAFFHKLDEERNRVLGKE